jgi:hypothetical protein
LKRPEAEIEGYLSQEASRLTWWAACREVVAELKRRFRDEFVPDPPCKTISAGTGAFNHICTSRWFLDLSDKSARTTESDVRDLLAAAHSVAQSNLADGTWRTAFAGREIYHHVGSQICNRQDPALHGYDLKGVEFDIDLAKDVGAWQTANNRIPTDLADLLAALRNRIVRNVQSP